jgi:antitoxin YefM
VSEADIQIVSNEAGEPTAVLVPIALWKEIVSERETAYLLNSEIMRKRLHDAMERGSGVPLDEAVTKLGL